MANAQKQSSKPIMTLAEERFIAFEGLIQWTEAVIAQSARVSAAQARLSTIDVGSAPAERRQFTHTFHTECHFFAISAHKLLEFRDWGLNFGLCSSVDFSEFSSFAAEDIRDLRNMREHVIDYFQGVGHSRDRWTVTTPDYIADASSVVGNLIGGRLDWIAFGMAAERLLPKLMAESMPDPSR